MKKSKVNSLESFQMPGGSVAEDFVKTGHDLEDQGAFGILKDSFRLNSTGTDDDLAIDIQDAVGRDASLSLVAGNIVVIVEGEIVTLIGEVYREAEKITIGNIATAFAGDDNVNNYLRVMNSSN